MIIKEEVLHFQSKSKVFVVSFNTDDLILPHPQNTTSDSFSGFVPSFDQRNCFEEFFVNYLGYLTPISIDSVLGLRDWLMAIKINLCSHGCESNVIQIQKNNWLIYKLENFGGLV